MINGSTLYELGLALVWVSWLTIGLCVLSAICAAAIARAKGTSVVMALAVGLILGPLGVILVASQRKPAQVVWGAPPVVSGPWGARCLAVSPNGMQCYLASSHAGLHLEQPPADGVSAP